MLHNVKGQQSLDKKQGRTQGGAAGLQSPQTPKTEI
jgi:hypothetical protein